MTHYGTVNYNSSKATVTLSVQSLYGKSEDIICVIDTGDTGDLSLPDETIARLGLTIIEEEEPVIATLAHGTTRYFSIYDARVLWHGPLRDVEMIDLRPDPFISMGLLRGSNLSIDAVPGGRVVITELPA